MLRSDWVSGAVLALFGLWVAWESRQYPLGSLQDPGPAYLPLILAVTLTLFGALVAIRGGASVALDTALFGDTPRVMLVVAGLVFAALAIERLGYRVTIAVLLVYYLGVLERRHVLAVGALTALMSIGGFYLFNNVLRVPLPVGAFGF